eukprot:jgi/Mesen1/8569/ME000497S07981
MGFLILDLTHNKIVKFSKLPLQYLFLYKQKLGRGVSGAWPSFILSLVWVSPRVKLSVPAANCVRREVSTNEVSGPIPAAISHLRHLVQLNLKENNLSGPIPPQIGNLTHLRIL